MIGRALILSVGIPLVAAGSVGLGLAYLPDAPLVQAGASILEDVIAAVASALPVSLPAAGATGFAKQAVAALAKPRLSFVAPLGLVLLMLAMRSGSPKPEPPRAEAQALHPPTPVSSKRMAKRAQKEATRLARSGQHREAAELLVANGLNDAAVKNFVKAEEFVRAAEVRHDQNRFLEAAELYERGGHFESAGNVYAQQNETARAAECYVKAGSLGLAAELFEKGGEFLKAAECYEKSELPRYAAQAYARCHKWESAARCLEAVLVEESTGAAVHDPGRREEIKQLVVQAGTFYERAGLNQRAESVLERGGCYAAAGDIALRNKRLASAVELFMKGNEASRAADALKLMGETKAAARVLGEHYRERGDQKESARCFEEAGEDLGAADMYRMLEEYEKAGACFERGGDPGQAAEMFRASGDRERSAQNYERSGKFAEAAECYALIGDTEREAELLDRAGRFLAAGEAHHRENRDDTAIKILQKVEPEHEDFAKASSLLGQIFHTKGMLSLAIKKFQQATSGEEIARHNVATYYGLATVHEENGEIREAVEIYEKILAFDYHYADVEERLSRTKAQLHALVPNATAPPGPGPAPTATAAADSPERYKIMGELGRGGMGIVYKAQDTVLDRVVAYKVLPGSLKENPQALRNFLREAKSAAQLNHPNIVTVYDAGEQHGFYYIAMEYVDGTTLKEILRRRGVIPLRGTLHVLRQMCDGLAFAHEKKIIHRDIKTANAMWTRDKKTKIMDFGLAKAVEGVRNVTTVVSGTPYYMSPEQTLGRNIDHRTDIYSLGVTVFEMVTGTLPFREGNIPYHHVHTPAPDVREINPKVPDFLAGIVARCLQKDPADRFQSTPEIVAAARAALHRGEGQTPE